MSLGSGQLLFTATTLTSCLKPFPHSVNMCPTLDNPANGNLVLSGNTSGETADYTCDTGFSLVGMSQRSCQSNGTWSGSEPTCESKNANF